MINRIKAKPEVKGYLSLVLHAHLPYIRHADRDDYMEERWFYEAMTETYLPLIDVFDRLTNDGVDFRITMSLTPTLLSLMADRLMQERYAAHLAKLIELAEREIDRLEQDQGLQPLARMYAQRFRELKAIYESSGRNLITRFRHYQDLGKLEIVTSAATHGFLPLMRTEEAITAQIKTAVRHYEKHLGRSPRGIWLPECGYTPGVDRILKSCGLQYFFADSKAVAYASPRPNRELLAPLMTPYGVTAFPRDPESSQQVWSSENGYPGDYNYREYYRDIGWDLGWGSAEEWEYIRPYVLPTNERVNTGIKYYRITGKGKHREPYNPEWARERAAEHAGNFMFNRQKQAEHWDAHLDRKPIIVSPYDAELFGHWWYEGPLWIEMLCRKIFHDQHELQMITPSEYLNEYPIADTGKLNESSWGRNGSAEVWLQGDNDWIYRHLHEAEGRMVQLATRHEHLESRPRLSASLLKRALNQAARELMLAQSSDWAFIMDSKTVVDYACKRTKNHLGCFRALCSQIEDGYVDEAFVAELEEKDNIFPDIDYRDYASIYRTAPVELIRDEATWRTVLQETKDRANVFLLAWEYPPKYVGGLSRAVCDLAEAMAAQGEIVHVVTSSHYGAPAFEKRNGVYVHRVTPLYSAETDFYHWTFEMNLAMIDHLVQWKEHGGRIDLLHAHDWMVYHTLREIKLSYGIPAVCTIHATEWGRNQGRLSTELSRNIHRLETGLAYDAEQVFVCSQAMKHEIQQLFHKEESKVLVFPNGVKRADAMEAATSCHNRDAAKRELGVEHEHVLYFVGRLVHEKGVQTLIHAMPGILSRVPNTVLYISGAGPMENELKQLAAHLGDRVRFTGFAHKEQKHTHYCAADVCVIPSLYEPFGIVALEAMMYQRPLVLSDTGGLAEMIEHGVDGYKALPGHVDSLVYHVTDLLLQPQFGRQMAERAFAKLEQRYIWEQLVNSIREQYRKFTHELLPAAPVKP
ncbi:1,4-alpha-glucan branching protein domain-containing protein [Paenibacillus sp. YYML68]|uniref:1,4-alpha-glucan branching protein domain-containing protein n=1 Tax=Paenibacillus sp. YYML68 TaxID=2909250 RepID=UPI002492E160|nr:1,4-alpha-glucan branching protein domain-containing protein [Paenibacillus sp. YYML68]